MRAYMIAALGVLLARWVVAVPRRPRLVGRRAWLRWAVLGTLAVVGGHAGLAAARLAWPNGVWGRDIVAIPLDQVPAFGEPPLRHDGGGFYLVRAPEGVLALAWECTHLGCTVVWQPTDRRFACPCHLSQFDYYYGWPVPGSVATRPLDMLEVAVGSDAVYVNTARRKRRSEDSPGLVTPLPPTQHWRRTGGAPRSGA